MAKNGKLLGKTYPIKSHNKVIDAMAQLAEAIADFETQMWEACREEAYQEGRASVFEEMNELSGKYTPKPPEEETIKPKAGLSELEKITDQAVYTDITNNPGWRTTDIITKALELPFKPTLVEKDVKLSINRLNRDGKIENKLGRWYSTQIKTGGQKYQVMTYMPDGSKYLGTDIIKDQ